MHLYLIRHAIAAPLREGHEDARRSLTARGRARWRRGVAGLDRLGVRFDRLHHSPWRRAVQTADMLSSLLDGESEVTDGLAAPPTRSLLGELQGERVAVVGHAPWLNELLAWLVTGRREDAARFTLKKGAVAWLEGAPEPGGMVLRALWSPRVLRAVGGRAR